MTRRVRVDELRVGDEIRMRLCEPVTVDEIVALEDGKNLVRWWRWSGESAKSRRYMWKHPREADGKPRSTRTASAR